MAMKATAYNFVYAGGAIELEDDMDRVTIVQSRSATINQLRRRAAKKLRAIADRLDAEAKHRRRADGHIQTDF